MSKKKSSTGLGKGLEALIPSIGFDKDHGFKVHPNEDEQPDKMLMMIDVHKILNNPYQPRKDFDPQALEDLKNSILQHGVISPITVRRAINGFELIAGERRLRAVKLAGIEKIPSYILDIDHGVEMLEIALIENVQREDLNPIEIAHGYKRLIDECHMTQEQVAMRVGKERATVTNFLRLLKLPDQIQESIRQKAISMGHARTLLALTNIKSMLQAWKEVLDNNLSVRATEQLVKELGKNESGYKTTDDKKEKHQEKQKKEFDVELEAVLNDLEEKLMKVFGTNVKIIPKTAESGTIQLDFFSKDHLEAILELFRIIEKNELEIE